MLASSISSSASSSYSAHSESSRFTRDFEEIKLLGKGAFGEVYHVKHNLDKKEYAMKIIPANKINQKDLREVLALSDFKHSGIVQYYCSFIDDCAKVAAGWTSYHSRSDTTFSSESAMETSLTCGATFIPGMHLIITCSHALYKVELLNNYYSTELLRHTKKFLL
ncbi:PREDICTED: interferon-induced, double-stranded RNA-activated protein kinase-like isoform X2 [Amphimedon queenslandica]|uniref:non-specific serine/threonine protein kinase n=1 Tax=Amphimedon queenslandica TaxID=400682 RepID=A0AAN0JRF1_AMPQE|nr:PREDICTED: interferon-induced, double-stranded RNA-activated protein kinase-like isoform X2 [Amphimedon queenslandica]|eukprot:XP_019859658.1 PREDICTED: interferon-induced, double-stranded RNA-activated protein kinase-like isoform X2 [Amphimedon queenslandica]